MTASNKTLDESLVAICDGKDRLERLEIAKQVRDQIEASYISKEAVVRAIPKRREQLIDMAGRLYEPEWLQGYNQAINEIRSKLKLDDKETT